MEASLSRGSDVKSNYLINPAHPDLKKLAIAYPEPFSFDSRIARQT